MSTDRELLELAAKAIGEKCAHFGGREYGLFKPKPNVMQPYVRWIPLDDDGDALRLAVKLKMLCDFDSGDLASARRAIVRAAAEIGRLMV